jgi:tetratricopeptide (TPR) repeat protein
MTPVSRRATVAGVLAAALALGTCTDDGGRPETRATPDPERQRVVEFWQHLSAANRARSGGNCAGAAALYEKALAVDPDHEDGLYYLGQCRRELGEPARARLTFERLVEVNPESARGHLALGALLASPNPDEPLDLEASERHLRRAHTINGEETGPVVRLGEVTLVTGRPDEAREWLEAALRTNAKSVEAALLAGYLAWEDGEDPAPLARRVRQAAAVEAPIHGVLNEGDRKDAGGGAARPLSHPLGRLLFGQPVDTVRALALGGTTPSDEEVCEAWNEVRRLRREYDVRRQDPSGT